jgi:hypothetical protein
LWCFSKLSISCWSVSTISSSTLCPRPVLFFFFGLDVDDLQAASLYEKASEERYLHTYLFWVFGLALTISADLSNLDIYSAKPVDSIGATSCSSKKFVLDWIGLDDWSRFSADHLNDKNFIISH